VRIGHVVQVERICRGEARNDSEFLDAEENERRPNHVEQLDGDKEHPEGDGAVDFLRREAHAVVANEH